MKLQRAKSAERGRGEERGQKLKKKLKILDTGTKFRYLA